MATGELPAGHVLGPGRQARRAAQAGIRVNPSYSFAATSSHFSR